MSSPHRVLIVEDQALLAKNLKSYLSRCGMEVRTAVDGEQALQTISSFEAEAVVMDYGLPGMDGLRTYAELVRRCGRQIDCVMITGGAAEGFVQHAIDQGVRHVLGKPFSFSELVRLLQDRAGAAAEDRSAQAA